MALKYRAYIIKSCSDNLQYFSLRFLVSLFETFALLFVRHRGSAQASGLNGMKRVTILYSHNQIFAYTKMHKKNYVGWRKTTTDDNHLSVMLLCLFIVPNELCDQSRIKVT